MNKYLLLILVTGFIFSTVLIAKDVDLSTFSKHMTQNVDEVLTDNPDLYDTQNIGRTPASVSNELDPVEENTKKLDQFQEQAAGAKNW